MVGRVLARALRLASHFDTYGDKGNDMTSTSPMPLSETIKVDIGVCTYRRPMVVSTLRSLFDMEIPEGVIVRIIVADNDAEPSAQASIDGLRAASPLRSPMCIARSRIFRSRAMLVCPIARRTIWPLSMTMRRPRATGCRNC